MKIAVFTKNFINPAYAAARHGAERAAARLGAQVDHYVPEIADDPIQQTALLERARTAQPDGIVLAPVHPTKLNSVLHAVNAAGIPLIGMISRSARGKWVSFVGSDDFRLALDLASHLFERLSGTGNVVIIEGAPDSTTSIDRGRGFRAAVALYPAIQIVGAGNGGYQREPAQREMTRLLTDSPRIDAVLSANDVMALGAIAALQAAGSDALVAGVNAIPEAIDAIKRGSMYATADYNAMNLGALATECAIRHVRGEPVPREIVLPVTIVDGGNVSAWDRPYAERTCLEWDEALRFAVK